ncbi:MAG TPA: CDP-glucose 4,6-dehydratase [Allosphingosinicella sp.]|nr:CDP-glucose 4,6-dehydratase [Allosphingosinicella sp.]
MEDVVTPSERLRGAYSGKSVLITGNTGFKGAWLALWLTRLGAKVTGFSEAIPTDPSHFERLALDYRTIFGDIADAGAVRSAVAEARPEIVFHLAAQSLVRRSYADPVATYRTNLIGSLTLFEACRAVPGVRAIVSATTDKVYRNREWDWGYRELDELGGADPYSSSKSCVELMTESWRHAFAGEVRVASVRAGNVIGGGDWAEDRLIPDIVRAAYGGQTLRIRNMRSTRPWQHVLDPLAGYLMVGGRLLAGEPVAEAWNFGPSSGRRIAVADIVDSLRERLPGLTVEHEPETSGRHESGLLELDSSKAANRLGWKPVWESEMLERSLEWYRAFYREDRLISDEQLDDYTRALDRAA